MSKTYYCHQESPIGITCQHASDDGRCLAATGWLGRLTVNCEYCRDYPYQMPVNDPSLKKIDWRNGLPQCPLNERRCEFNIDDNECSRYWQCKPPKKSKPIKVKVKKCKRRYFGKYKR